MVSKNSKKSIVSVLFTFFIIGFLILSGPVEAVTVSLSADKTSYSTEETITFDVGIDIETNERVPIQDLTLTVIDPNDNSVKTCVFKSDGTPVSGCDNMVITPTIDTLSYGYGYQQGYGYGYSATYGYGTQNNDFGYGYGYGYTTSTTGELKYKITWDLSSETMEIGTYSATLAALAKTTTKEYKFLSSEISFIIDTILVVTTNPPAVSPGNGEYCTPSWTCTDWSSCIEETQTRTCIDANYCGTTTNKPAEEQDCITPVFEKFTGTDATEEQNLKEKDTVVEQIRDEKETGLSEITGGFLGGALDTVGGRTILVLLILLISGATGVVIRNKIKNRKPAKK